MSDFRFGVDDYRLDYYPHDGVYDEQDCIDWSKVECVEIDWETFVRERTCKFVSSKGSDYPPVCSACGYELGIYDCEWFDDGTYGYGGNYCPNCGARVIGAEADE